MTMREFVRTNRIEIDAAVVKAYGENSRPTNDASREDWVLNDEGLYNWAKSFRVPV